MGALIFNLFEGVQQPIGATGAGWSRATGRSISNLIADGEIKGKKGALTLIHTLGKIKHGNELWWSAWASRTPSPILMSVVRTLRSDGGVFH